MLKLKFVLLLSSGLLFLLPKIYAQADSITVSGHIKGLGNQSVWLSFTNSEKQNKNYRQAAKNDQFSFKIPKQEIPAIARFNVVVDRAVSSAAPGNPIPALDLFVYNKDITITGSADAVQFASISGDTENNIFNIYKDEVRADEMKSYAALQAIVTKSGDAGQLMKEGTEARKRIYPIQKKFVHDYPDAFLSIFLLNRMQNIYNANDFTLAWNRLSDRYKSHPVAQGSRDFVKKVSNTLAGTPVVDFERKDKDGNVVSLKAYKGRIILLDFWGSWCGPCRASHPHLKELYSKYKSKGFEIIAIAQERNKTIEESRANWLKAIKDDGINWVHILNQDGIEKQDLIKSYQISAFPTKILVDGNGKIILRITASATDDIDKALEKIYGY